jgi:hypothetical protein
LVPISRAASWAVRVVAAKRFTCRVAPRSAAYARTRVTFGWSAVSARGA